YLRYTSQSSSGPQKHGSDGSPNAGGCVSTRKSIPTILIDTPIPQSAVRSPPPVDESPATPIVTPRRNLMPQSLAIRSPPPRNGFGAKPQSSVIFAKSSTSTVTPMPQSSTANTSLLAESSTSFDPEHSICHVTIHDDGIGTCEYI